MQKAQSEQISLSASGHPVNVKVFAQTPYLDAYNAMLDFTKARDGESQDQIWLIQHPSVYTQGTACEQVTLLPSEIPVVKTDRGGQITYHGPGQVVMYPLLNLRRYGIGVKALVANIEQSIIDLAADVGVCAERRDNAPGVYVGDAKIAALGLRIRRGHSYHGLSFNIGMDLSPFSNIDPCGYQGLRVTQLSDESNVDLDYSVIEMTLVKKFLSLI